MILSKNFKDFRSEDIYNEKINKPNVQLVELIFKKVYDTNTNELEKKTKYRNFFLNRRNKESRASRQSTLVLHASLPLAGGGVS